MGVSEAKKLFSKLFGLLCKNLLHSIALAERGPPGGTSGREPQLVRELQVSDHPQRPTLPHGAANQTLDRDQ